MDVLLNDSNLFSRYRAAIRTLPLKTIYAKEDLLIPDFLLHQEGQLRMFYAPHNEYFNPQAKIVIVGITPGWTQMELAFRQARICLEQGLPEEQIYKQVKRAARFAGSMRKNLVDMLNALELQHYLRIENCEQLFQEEDHLLHTTSGLKYPVFLAQSNYNGHSPCFVRTPFLREFALESLKLELARLDRPVLIPLGKSVEAVFRLLTAEGLVHTEQCLWGFPHPSGANGHRSRVFMQEKDNMKEFIAKLDT